MDFNLSSILSHLDTHVNVFFILDGEKYEVEHFAIGFAQDVDFKGQPQNEVKGGQITLMFTQALKDGIYTWAKQSTLRKSGLIQFWSDLRGSVLEINFVNANCIHLTHKINSMTGMETTIAIAPEEVVMNGITHSNKWRN